MDIVIGIGAALSLIGVGLLVWCIRAALKARREAPDEAQLKARLQQLAAVNMGALALSSIGLMIVVAGMVLG